VLSRCCLRISPNVTTSELVRVFVILDDRSSLDHPLGEAVETFLRLEDAERFIAEVRGDEPELAEHLRIEERELDASSSTN
jgi:hypothetical protein